MPCGHNVCHKCRHEIYSQSVPGRLHHRPQRAPVQAAVQNARPMPLADFVAENRNHLHAQCSKCRSRVTPSMAVAASTSVAANQVSKFRLVIPNDNASVLFADWQNDQRNRRDRWAPTVVHRMPEQARTGRLERLRLLRNVPANALPRVRTPVASAASCEATPRSPARPGRGESETIHGRQRLGRPRTPAKGK